MGGLVFNCFLFMGGLVWANIAAGVVSAMFVALLGLAIRPRRLVARLDSPPWITYGIGTTFGIGVRDI